MTGILSQETLKLRIAHNTTILDYSVAIEDQLTAFEHMVITRSQTKVIPSPKQTSEPTEKTRAESSIPSSSQSSTAIIQKTHPQRKLSEIKEAFEQIEKFFGNENENIEKWLHKVDEMCSCFNDINDPDKFKRIPTKLGPAVFDWFTENKADMNDWESFKKKITEKYPVIVMKIHPLILVDNFNKRCKRDEETIVQYYHAKMELANKVDPRMIESIRVAALIDGLPSSLRRRLAYKKTEMLTPEKFLLMAQTLEQEIELISREALEEQMSHLSLKAQYPQDNQETGHLVTSIRNINHNEETQQPMYQHNNTTEQQKWRQQGTFPQTAGHSRWSNDHQWRSRHDIPSHRANAHPPHQNQTAMNCDASKQHGNQWKETNQGNHQRTNDHHWTNGNNTWQCYTCGEFGHIARNCQRHHLKE